MLAHKSYMLAVDIDFPTHRHIVSVLFKEISLIMGGANKSAYLSDQKYSKACFKKIFRIKCNMRQFVNIYVITNYIYFLINIFTNLRVFS